MSFQIKGLIAAPFSPLNGEGELNVAVIPQYYEFLRKNGIKGVFINGTSGEAFSLTKEERIKIVEGWAEAREAAGDDVDDFKLIVQVGATGIQDELALAKHLKDVNVDGFSTMAPIFFKPSNIPELLSHLQKVAGVNPELPFYYYHIPVIHGVNFPMLELLDLLQKEQFSIPNFMGIKFSEPNFYDYMDSQVKYGGKYDMPFCSDQILICALTLGAEGSIGSTYNFSAPLTNRIMNLFQEGKILEARNLESSLNSLLGFIRSKGSYFAIAKALLKKRGINLGRVRSPLKNLNELEKKPDIIMEQVIKYIETANLSQYMNK